MAAEASESHAGGLLHVDLACVGCGYRLLGEPLSGRCPQCGIPVRRTVRSGDLLVAETGHLSLLSRALGIVQFGLLCQVVFVASMLLVQIVIANAGWNVSPGVIEATSSAFGVISALIIAQGWWMFTESRRGGAKTHLPERAVERKVVRSAVFVHTLITVVALLGKWLIVLPSLTPWQGTVATIVMFAGIGAFTTFAVQFFAVMGYLGRAARALRDQALVRYLNRRAWTIPLWFTFGIVLMGLGPVIAFVQFYTAVGAVRRRLRLTLEAHRVAELALDHAPDHAPGRAPGHAPDHSGVLR